MIGAVGDLVEDVAVRLGGPVHVASDTDAVITRRRGGSAANVVAAAGRLGSAARFIGQVGADAAGDRLIEALMSCGVEIVGRRGGRTGTVVAIVDSSGERTMLSDRGAATELSDPDMAWAAGLGALHVPLYSLAVEPLAGTSMQLASAARTAGAMVSVDASSVGVLDRLGHDAVLAVLAAVAPDVVLVNQDEAAWFGGRLAEGVPLTVVKHGPRPAVVFRRGEPPVEVPALALERVPDTTGAGDAFAAGFLVASLAGADPETAAAAGHQSAAAHLTTIEVL